MSTTLRGLPTAEQLPNALATPVEGWAYDPVRDEHAVIVNPDASQYARLAWALGQLQQVEALASYIGCSASENVVEVGTVVGALRHFSAQAVQVLADLAEDMHRHEVASSAD